MKIKKALKRTWHFIWVEDSIASWIVNIVLAFVLIKFIVYPGLGLLLGTTHPIVAVVSSSMEHGMAFDEWWKAEATCDSGKCTQGEWYKQNNISKSQFTAFSFKNGFSRGDIMILKGKPPENIQIGDVIVFKTNLRSDPIIHRVVHKSIKHDEYSFQTKGDNNPYVGEVDKEIREKDVIGRAAFRVPFLGYIKIWFVELLRFAHII